MDYLELSYKRLIQFVLMLILMNRGSHMQQLRMRKAISFCKSINGCRKSIQGSKKYEFLRFLAENK